MGMPIHPSEAPEPLTLPPADPPPSMDIHQLPTGAYTTRAAFAIQGGSIFDKRRFAAVSYTHLTLPTTPYV